MNHPQPDLRALAFGPYDRRPQPGDTPLMAELRAAGKMPPVQEFPGTPEEIVARHARLVAYLAERAEDPDEADFDPAWLAE